MGAVARRNIKSKTKRREDDDDGEEEDGEEDEPMRRTKGREKGLKASEWAAADAEARAEETEREAGRAHTLARSK